MSDLKESYQKKITRVRPPRVHITYDVEIGDAIEKRELPLVVGVMADVAGKSEKHTLPVRDRKFVEIDRDNFDKVMEGIEPRLAFSVDNLMQNDNTKLQVELRFKSIKDFRPESIVKQYEPLRKLFQARTRLNDLIAKLDGNDQLNGLLQKIAKETDEQAKVQKALEGEVTNG
jgi:type VI secretion system protein ImpB